MDENLIIKSMGDTCKICQGPVETVIDLKNLPITGVYGPYNPKTDQWSVEQALQVCSSCGHGQLKNMIDTSLLYGDQYSFRTSKSATSRAAVEKLIKYLNSLFPSRAFERIVDFGCNDAYLLKQIKQMGNKLLGIDLIWRGRENEFSDNKIRVTGEFLENIDFTDILGGTPDLVLSQHTLEHVPDPLGLLKTIYKKTDNDTIFLFELPCFDILLQHFRIDQIFHEHFQYYSMNSFFKLLDRCGFETIDYTYNLSHWGALLIAFKKKGMNSARNRQDKTTYPKITSDLIKFSYEVFLQQARAVKSAVNQVAQEGIWGYGAALMLPVLGYHLDTKFSEFEAILDDDPQKDGQGYMNLPVTIQQPRDFNFSSSNILLTALDNRRPILRNLLSQEVKRIIQFPNIL